MNRKKVTRPLGTNHSARRRVENIMLKRLFLVAVVLAGLISSSSAQLLHLVGDDMGDRRMKFAIQREMWKLKNPSGQEFAQRNAELQTFSQKFYGMKEEEMVALFGPPIPKAPHTFALPVYQPGCLLSSGMVSLSEPHNPHQSFYEIGDFAAAEVFYWNRGDRVTGILFYLRSDKKFPRLQSWSDLKPRMAWEDSRLRTLKSWVEQRQKNAAHNP